MDKAKVFWSGRSQAVRLPKKYRFDTDEVSIRKEGDNLVLIPKPASGLAQWAWLDEIVGPVDADFARAALERPKVSDEDIDPIVVEFFK